MLLSLSELIYSNCVEELLIYQWSTWKEAGRELLSWYLSHVLRQQRYSEVLPMHFINKVIINIVFIVLAPKGQN